jgi:hypothetical protein
MHTIPEARAHRLKRVAIALSLAPWFFFIAAILLWHVPEKYWHEWTEDWAVYCQIALVISGLVFSPVALVLFIISFRGSRGVVRKILWILCTIIPFIFGLLAMGAQVVAWLFDIR